MRLAHYDAYDVAQAAVVTALIATLVAFMVLIVLDLRDLVHEREFLTDCRIACRIVGRGYGVHPTASSEVGCRCADGRDPADGGCL